MDPQVRSARTWGSILRSVSTGNMLWALAGQGKLSESERSDDLSVTLASLFDPFPFAGVHSLHSSGNASVPSVFGNILLWRFCKSFAV